MPVLDEYLRLDRCPHCSIDNPNLSAAQTTFQTKDDRGYNPRFWRVYKCLRCGGVVVAVGKQSHSEIVFAERTYPGIEAVDQTLPDRVKAYLQQAIDSTAAPAGAVILCACAVDEMLKVKSYTTGSLYNRIKKAAEDKVLTVDMETWAHQVRLDANDQRHADQNAGLPTIQDAKLAIEFTKTLAEFLFLLPAKVTRGIASSATPQTP